MIEPNGDLTDSEREAIAGLPREAAPPAGLEETTVRALAARGLLRGAPHPIRRGLERGLGVAAAILLFAGGYAAGRGGAGPAPVELPRFALLLYEGPEYRATPPGEEGERVKEYGEWAAERGAAGELEAGEKLRDDSEIVLRPDGTVASAPSAPGGTRLAGFFLIRAADNRSALEIARSCPHARYGGSIVIREIEPT